MGATCPKKYCFRLLLHLVCSVYVSSSWILQLTTLFAFLNKSFWILLSPCSAISVTEVFPLYFYIRLLLLPAAFLFDLLSEVRNYWLCMLCWFSCLPFERIIIIMQFLQKKSSLRVKLLWTAKGANDPFWFCLLGMFKSSFAHDRKVNSKTPRLMI